MPACHFVVWTPERIAVTHVKRDGRYGSWLVEESKKTWLTEYAPAVVRLIREPDKYAKKKEEPRDPSKIFRLSVKRKPVEGPKKEVPAFRGLHVKRI